MANLFKNINFGDLVTRRDGKKCIYIANDGIAPFKYRVRLLSDNILRIKEIEEIKNEDLPYTHITLEEPIFRNNIYNGDYYVKFNGSVTMCSKWKCKEDIIN